MRAPLRTKALILGVTTGRAVDKRPDSGQPRPLRVDRRFVQKKIAGFLVIIFALFWILSAPTAASGSVNHLVANTRSAGESMVTFMQGILGSDTTSHNSTSSAPHATSTGHRAG